MRRIPLGLMTRALVALRSIAVAAAALADAVNEATPLLTGCDAYLELDGVWRCRRCGELPAGAECHRPWGGS